MINCFNNFMNKQPMNNSQPEQMQPFIPMKPTDERGAFSPHRNRVFYKKYINEVNQALQSLITAGRLKRMELMSINNRALFNRGKVQRCQWTSKKHHNQSFFPDVKNLNLNNTTPKNQNTSGKRNKTQGKNLQTSRYQQNYLDLLIQQQIKRIKKQDLLHSGQSQQQIVKQACKSIEQKLIQNHSISTNANANPSTVKKNLSPTFPISFQHSRNKFLEVRKDHKRSVTETVYSQQIQEIEKKNIAYKKQRQQYKKFFLRKIKLYNHRK